MKKLSIFACLFLASCSSIYPLLPTNDCDTVLYQRTGNQVKMYAECTI